MQYGGGCHCGALKIQFESAIAPEAMAVRACQCSFCRKHAASAVSDPAGSVHVILREPASVQRYRFGLATTDFLVCGRCGVYAAAVMEEAGRHYAIVIVAALDEAARFTQPAVPMDYSGEDEAARRARRRTKGTPARTIAKA